MVWLRGAGRLLLTHVATLRLGSEGGKLPAPANAFID
jgi:hypothetical protein